jgi:MFS family permease
MERELESTKDLPAPPTGVPKPENITRSRGMFSSLRHRNFQLYFGGQLISVAGTWIQIIAQGWLVYQITHSEFLLGVTSFAAAVPALIVSPWGGAVVDRVPKRTLLVITQSGSMLLAFVLAWLTYTNRVTEWQIIVLAAMLGFINSFDAPGRQAFYVEMVERQDLSNAIAMNSLMFNSARVIGPAVGGIMLATIGTAACFFINGLSFLAVIIGLLLMRLPKVKIKAHTVSLVHDLRSGMGYLVHNIELAGLILIALVFNFFGMSYTAILPAFVDQVLKHSAAAYGWLNAASGLGAVAAALFIASNGERGQRGRWLTTANLVFPILLMVFAFTVLFPVSLVLAFGLGIGFMLQFTLINTLLQTRVSDEMRGRIMGVYTLTIFGVGPFGNLVMGWLAQSWGLSLTIALSAAVALALSIVILIRIPVIAKLK